MKFYVCPVCGNVIYMMNGDVSRVRCCGKEMALLVPNTVDASHEKHVPLCNVSQNKIEVEVGEVMHPMESDHYIMWIAVVKGENVEIVHFNPGDEPKWTFDYTEGSIVYAYCNKHGLWKKEIQFLEIRKRQ